MGIHLKDLSKSGYRDNVVRGLAAALVNEYYRHETKKRILAVLDDALRNPEIYESNEIWSKLAGQLSPALVEKIFTSYDLLDESLAYKIYGSKHIKTSAKQRMNLAMCPPVTPTGVLMSDVHAGYGLPIGGVLAIDSVVIPYAVEVDIGYRMSLTLFGAREDFLRRYSHQMKKVLKEFTRSGMDSGLPFVQEHEVLDREKFRMTELLGGLHGKAVQQLGGSNSGNHFVEFGRISLQADNVSGVPEDSYAALLSHSGSRGLSAVITKHYGLPTRDIYRLPHEAQYFVRLGSDTEEGQKYQLSMNLVGDYAHAYYERTYLNLAKVLGLKPLANMNNHHNFTWKEELASGQTAIVHRKGATPAQKGLPELTPGSMATPDYLACRKGVGEALCSVSHEVGCTISRQEARDSFTQSALKKHLSQAGVILIDGSVEKIPLAYKDVDRVIQTQGALVEIQGTSMPCIVRMNKEQNGGEDVFTNYLGA